MILLDGRGGSQTPGRVGSSGQLALYEPVRSLLAPCSTCDGTGSVGPISPVLGHPLPGSMSCSPCAGTGRQLSRITTRHSASGPDVLFAGNGPDSSVSIAAEVKSLVELLAAGDSGRLAGFDGQLPAMLAEGYDQCWLLVYGISRAGATGLLEVPRNGATGTGNGGWVPFTTGDGREVPYGYLHGLLVEVAAMGVHTRVVRDIKEAAAWVGVLYRWWTKPWGEHDLTKRFDRSRKFPVQPFDSRELVAAAEIIAKFPARIGYEKARAAAVHFGSVEAAVNATTAEWVKVPGVGKTLAAAIYNGLRAKVKESE